MYTIYERLLVWKSTRPIEVGLVFFNLAWALQVFFRGSAYSHVLPVCFFSWAIGTLGLLRLLGLLADNLFVRKLTLFCDMLIWVFLLVTLLFNGEIGFIYAAFAFASGWTYLVLSINKSAANGVGAWHLKS